MVPVLSTPPFCLRPAYWPGVGVANCCDALMLILPFPEELMNALGAGAPAEGVNAEEVTLDRLPIMLPSMYHINGLLTPPLWGVVLVAGAALEANAVDVGSPAFAGASSILASFVVSTLSQEKFKSGVSLLSDVPATLAAASQSSLLWYTGMDIACVAARLERVSASFCTPQAASAENTTATAAVFAKRWHRTDQVMPVSSIRAGAFRVRIVLLIVSVYHMKTGLSTDYFAQTVAVLHKNLSMGGFLIHEKLLGVDGAPKDVAGCYVFTLGRFFQPRNLFRQNLGGYCSKHSTSDVGQSHAVLRGFVGG